MLYLDFIFYPHTPVCISIMATEHTQTLVWPPKNGPTSPSVPRDAAVLTTLASIRIAAPAASVFKAVLDVDNYPQWNTFVPRVTIHSQPSEIDDKTLHKGTLFTFHVVMDEKKPNNETATQLLVTDVSTPDSPSDYLAADLLEDDTFTADLSTVYRISWRCEGGFASKGLKTERFHEVIALGPNECEVRTWENQAGVLAYTVRWFFQKTLNRKFQLWCDDLKKFCEGKSNAGS